MSPQSIAWEPPFREPQDQGRRTKVSFPYHQTKLLAGIFSAMSLRSWSGHRLHCAHGFSVVFLRHVTTAKVSKSAKGFKVKCIFQ